MDIERIFTHFPRLETERLILRQIELSDAASVFETFADEAVMEFYGEMPHRSVEESRELIRRQQEWYARREGIRWGITRKGEDAVIGSCGLFKFDEDFQRAELGYELARASWRQGIMREALRAIITFALSKMGLSRIEAVVDDSNKPSKALLRALGFSHEGTLRQRFFFRGRFWDEHYFGLLKEEWPQPPGS